MNEKLYMKKEASVKDVKTLQTMVILPLYFPSCPSILTLTFKKEIFHPHPQVILKTLYHLPINKGDGAHYGI